MSQNTFYNDFDQEGNLNNDPTKYPFKPVELNEPNRFPEKNITQAKLNQLRPSPNPTLEKRLKIINEVNEIKYRVLYANNLGQTNYEHLYFVEHHSSDSFPDYFTDILDKLIDIFSDSTIEYTLLKDRQTASVNNGNKDIHRNDYNLKKASNITLKENGKYSVTNTIQISWS